MMSYRTHKKDNCTINMEKKEFRTEGHQEDPALAIFLVAFSEEEKQTKVQEKENQDLCKFKLL
jgi:hypothetical protein